jgi:hypothetical protein
MTNGYHAELTALNEGDSMNRLKRILTLTAPLLLYAGAALASTSGIVPIDTALNTLGRAAEATGFMIGGIGTIGIVHHVRSGSWLGAAEHLGLATTGGAIVYNYPTIAPVFGGSASALVHAALTHPAAHLALHAVARLVS